MSFEQKAFSTEVENRIALARSLHLVQRDCCTVSCIRITAIFYIRSEEQSDKRLIPKCLLPLDFFALKVVIPNIADSGGGESVRQSVRRSVTLSFFASFMGCLESF